MLDQERMRLQKVLIGIRYVIRIGGSILLEKHLLCLQVEDCGCRCIIKGAINYGKGHLILVEGVL